MSKRAKTFKKTNHFIDDLILRRYADTFEGPPQFLSYQHIAYELISYAPINKRWLYIYVFVIMVAVMKNVSNKTHSL